VSWYIKIQVTIKTQRGTFVRESGIYEMPDAEAADLEINGGVLNYPDLRATQFEILSSDAGGGPFGTCRTVTDGLPAIFEATRSTVNNLAYAIIDNINLTDQVGAGAGKYAGGFGKSGDAVDTDNDRDPNRMLVSLANLIFDLPARSALYMAGPDTNAILGFEANLLPVGEEQFGFAPLLAICVDSVFALEVGTSAPFSRVHAVSNVGALGRYAFANANGFIFIADSSGVWVLSPLLSEQPFSLPLHSFDASADILDDLDTDTVISYVDDGRGNREIRIGTANKTYVFSRDYGKWYTLARSRAVQLPDGQRLLGFDAIENELVEELQTTDVGLLTPAGVEFRIKTAPYKLLHPGAQKRFYRIALRQRAELDELVYTFYEPLNDAETEAEEDAVITEADTDAVPAYLESVTVSGVGELVTGLVLPQSVVVDVDEGAVVASGVLHRGGDTDQATLYAARGRDIYALLTGKGKPGQAIESVEFEFEPRTLHRDRRRNYKSTLP
jgi:hypothetical protein